MNKYKICPSCGTKNPPTVLECITCETDLTAVRAVDEFSEKLQTEPSTDSKSGKMSEFVTVEQKISHLLENAASAVKIFQIFFQHWIRKKQCIIGLFLRTEYIHMR